MNHFLRGFADELQKHAAALGALRGAGKFVAKHPLVALTAAGTVAGTAMAARSAYKSGLRGGEKPRYLVAGDGMPSQAAYVNYHQLFNEKPKRGDLRRLHRWYDSAKFKR